MPTSRRRARRHPPQLWQAPVLRTERVTPRMIRVTVGGELLADFPGGGGDQHVVLYFYAEGAELPEPLTLNSARVAFATARPQMRSYTVRRHDPDAHEIDIDFVLHEDGGPAVAWARRARPGDTLILVGPSPAYLPEPGPASQLLVGDETALPAIGAILADLPATAGAEVIIEVADAAERQPLPTAAKARISWLHRDGRPAGTPDLLLDAVGSVDLSDSDGVRVWAAGERSTMLALRAHLLDERGLTRGQVRSSSYWRHGHAGSPGAG